MIDFFVVSSIVCVHGAFVNDAIKRFKDCGIIKSINCTNTHYKTTLINDDFVKVNDVAQVIADGLNIKF